MDRCKTILLVTGLPGAGKSLFSEVARRMGIPVLVMGDVIREEARGRGVEPTPDLLTRITKEIREKEGSSVVALRVMDLVTEIENDVVLIDGARSLHEVQAIRDKYKKTCILAVHASPRTRFRRLKKRDRLDDPEGWDEFWHRDLAEINLGIGGVIALADYMLVNEKISLKEAVLKASEIIKEAIEAKSCHHAR